MRLSGSKQNESCLYTIHFMAELTLQNISKIYEAEGKERNNKKAVDNISFAVHDKEFMVMVGPSGCGKSTLLRMIAGLEEISEGTLAIDGKRMNELSPRERDIAMVFQNYALYPHMTVYDNMAFGLRLKNYSKTEIKERVMQTAALLEITDELHRKPKNLSGGQRQRVAIGRAIIRRPKIFLFDEPLSNLDAKLRTQMRIELQKLHREINATMIYVTHDQTEAMTLGQRIAVLQKGKLMQLDTPLHLYNQPANKFVAGFIGSPTMNFIKGKLVKKEENYGLEIDTDFFVSLGNGVPATVENKIGEWTEIGIRPEHIAISSSQTNRSFPVEVVAYENMGNEQLIYVSFLNHTMVIRKPNYDEITIGKRLFAAFEKESILFFDVDSDEVIK